MQVGRLADEVQAGRLPDTVPGDGTISVSSRFRREQMIYRCSDRHTPDSHIIEVLDSRHGYSAV